MTIVQSSHHTPCDESGAGNDVATSKASTQVSVARRTASLTRSVRATLLRQT